MIRQQLMVMDGVAACSHIIMAYRVRAVDPYTRLELVKENFDSDDDHGIGRALLRHISDNQLMDYVCFATRDCEPDSNTLD